MLYPKNFLDYKVLSCGNLSKIEKIGKYILKRPDPQAIWKGFDFDKYKINAIYTRSNTGGGNWEFFDLPNAWNIKYELPNKKNIVFNLKPFSFKHIGIFPEQAVNWDFLSNIIINSKKGKKFKVLNLFAYTGGATIACALSDAFVTHVDSSKGIISLAKENAISSNVPNDRIRWIVDDCKKFVKREISRGNFYDGIIMDPPSYGRGPNGEVWKLEDNLYDLIELSSNLLNKDSNFFVINSYTTGIQASVMKYMVSYIIKNKFGGKVFADEIGLFVENTGLILPEGATCRYENNV